MPYQDLLQEARQLAQTARFPDFLACCQGGLDRFSDQPDAVLAIGALLFDAGFLQAAQRCFQHVRQQRPNDSRPLINLANVARESGRHGEARAIYDFLLAQLPNHAVIRRNALVSLEYDPDASEAERVQRAREWGTWAIEQAGGPRPRPPMPDRQGQPLRVGYVSADCCQHTVGLFLREVLKAHHPEQVKVFVYSAGAVHDWVSQEIAAVSTWRAVAGWSDVTLAEAIRSDAIDVLVDLSGHTAGSRLSVFAHRPAPVQLSWLGYFATTGLPYIDAVLLDEAHVPAGYESGFVEPVWRLPVRWLYAPVPWAPPVAAPPSARGQGVTFGCFNHTAKLNPAVFAVWAQVLKAVPAARLVLKWRTFLDAALGDAVRAAFAAEGIDPCRLALRGPSFHAAVLNEYADIDIALDPFPFTGGLTSCEALWMGVPVVTWPQTRAVSRQTASILQAIGRPEWIAHDAADYVRIATELAADPSALAALRTSLRGEMQASVLMDTRAFVTSLEAAYRRGWAACFT